MQDILSINKIHEMTGVDRRTIKKWLVEGGKNPETATMRDFIEVQTARVKLRDRDGEQKELERRTRLQSDLLEIDLARARNEVIETETVFRVWENVIVAIRRVILTSNLPDESKDAILKELVSLPIETYVEQREFDQGAPAENAAAVHATGEA